MMGVYIITVQVMKFDEIRSRKIMGANYDENRA